MTDSPVRIDEPEIEDIGSNVSSALTMYDLIQARLSRRAALRGLVGGGAAALFTENLITGAFGQVIVPPRRGGPSTLTFQELRHQLSQDQSVAEGYEIQVVIRWGDPVLTGAPAYSPNNLTAESQALQFGYNNDYLDYFPLPQNSRNSDHGLLCVNHEYTNTNLMFAGIGSGRAARGRTTKDQAAVEIAAHGMSVVEVKRENGKWGTVLGSRLNRRITMNTPMQISGPAAGHIRMRTNGDPTGKRVLGTLNNCAGGNTPWGTVITAEENFSNYFGGEAAQTGPQASSYRRYGILREGTYAWSRHFDRFNLDNEPNEPNRFGWVVEFDPYDPQSVPIKRTALGRFKHEGATHAVSHDGRVAFYMGDDERFEYVYKFVTARPWNPSDIASNRDLMDEGTLFVAQFAAEGRMRWLALVHGQGPLTEANGFNSQADVVIEARRAADLVGATPMDRPEDVETNSVNGRVYVMLTNNNRRTPEQVNPANPRARSLHGHIIEVIPPGAGTDRVDHAATEARWEIFLAAGKPGHDPGTQYHRAISDSGWFSSPDNCAFDSKGRIWIATDGGPENAGIADGIWAADTSGYGRALTRLFYQSPTGAEVCGPRFTPDERTLFIAIQHPGEDPGSTFESPSTRWPDFVEGAPPRPSVIAIIKKDGGVIGT
jgi:uncharacterized protein